MKPIFLKNCSGWFHPAGGRCGVVLCSAYGQEELFTHRAWRAFAARLAAAGFPALRFDYHGTGDSAGDDEQPGRVGAWVDSVRSAVDWMRSDAGMSQVALIGFRLGALLAAITADEIGGVDALVLMGATASGGSFLHELKALARFAPPIPDEPPPPPDRARDFEAAGFVLTAETQAALKPLDATKIVNRPAPKVLLLNRTDAKPPVALAAHLRSLGSEVEEEEFADFQRLLRTTHGEPVPDRPFAQVSEWLARQMGPGAAVPATRDQSMPAANPGARLALPGVEERPVFLDGHKTLFGVHAKAIGPSADPALPVFVFVNNGAIHHVGTNRMSVWLARRLAAQGFSSLRFDIGGIGDSGSRPGRADGLLYCKDSYGDLKTALDWLEARGHTRCITVGLCAGGTLALTGAVRDPRVVGQVLINPGRFFLGDGETTQALVAKAVRPAGDYLRMLVRPSAWRNLLSGRRSLSAVVPGLARRGLNTALRVVRGAAPGNGTVVPGGSSQVERWFRAMSKRGVATLMVYSVGDFTLGQFETHLGKDGAKLKGMKNVRVEYLRAADHSLTRRHARERLAELLDAYAEERRRDALSLPIDRAS